METQSKETVTIIAEGGTSLDMSKTHARMSGTIANMLDDIDDDDDTAAIPILNIKIEIWEKVKHFLETHPDAGKIITDEEQLEMRTKPLEGWEREFVDVSLAILLEMILAANFLDIKSMLDVTCKAVAEMIKGKTPTEIKKVFGVDGDFSPEEQEQVLRENPWLEALEEEQEAPTSGGGGGSAAAAMIVE